jgi:hypothetical protein
LNKPDFLLRRKMAVFNSFLGCRAGESRRRKSGGYSFPVCSGRGKNPPLLHHTLDETAYIHHIQFSVAALAVVSTHE